MIAAVERYLAMRRAAGFTLSNTEYLLRSLCRLRGRRRSTPICAPPQPSLGPARRHRLRNGTPATKPSAASLSTSAWKTPGTNRHQKDHFGYRKTRRVPHIYSRNEITHLVLAATNLPSVDSLQPRTYAALISVLAATGLRISEALHLLVSDVTPDGLVVRQTKFQKTRLVPLHDTAAAGLGRYLMHRQDTRKRRRPCVRVG